MVGQKTKRIKVTDGSILKWGCICPSLELQYNLSFWEGELRLWKEVLWFSFLIETKFEIVVPKEFIIMSHLLRKKYIANIK